MRIRLYRSIHCAEHGFDRRKFNVRVGAGTPDEFAGGGFDLDKGQRGGFGAAGEALLAVGGDFELRCPCVSDQRIDKSGDRAVASAYDAAFITVHDQTTAAGEDAVHTVGMKVMQREGRLALDVFLPEHLLQFRAADLATERIDNVVGDGAELALHVLRQLDAELTFQKIRDAAFAALRIHTDDLAVFAADVVRVDGQIRHVPGGLVLFIATEALLDSILMAAAEGGEDKFARIRLARRHGHAGGALIHLDEAIHVAKVELRVHAVHVQIHRNLHDVEIAGALAVSKQRALDTIRACKQSQLRGGGAGATVIVRVQADDEALAVFDVGADPLDLVGIHIGHADLDGVGQVEDHLVLRRGLPHVHDGLADFLGEFDLRGAEALGRVLQRDLRTAHGETMQAVFDHLCSLDGHGDDFLLRLAEHILSLRRRGGVVHVDDDLLRPDKALNRLFDQILPCLNEALDGHIIGDAVFFDESAVEAEFGIRGGGKADLDLLETAFHQRIKHIELLRDIHRHSKSLIAITEIDTAPDGRFRDGLGGPATIRQRDGVEPLVFGGRTFQHNRTELDRICRVTGLCRIFS